MYTIDHVQERIIGLLSEMVEGWDLDLDEGIGAATTLVADIGFASVDFIQLVVAIETAYRSKLGFQDLLMRNGAYVEDLSVGEIADFVTRRLNGGAADAAPAPAAAPATTRITEVADSERVSREKIERFRGSIAPRALVADGTPRNAPALFVLSPPRSGSTLLRVILAGNSRLFAPPELHLLPYNTMGERFRALSGEYTDHLLEGAVRAVMQVYGCSGEDARKYVRQCEEADMTTKEFYRRLQVQLKGERLLVDKTPSYVIDIDILKRAERDFDNPLYIHLVRHPCGMVRSYEESKLQRLMPMVQEASFGSRELAELTWLTAQQNTLAFAQQVPPQRWLQVRYEDIVCDPEPSIRRICEFLGVPYDDRMVNPYEEMDQRMTDGVDTASKMSGDLKFHLHNAINPEAAVRWKQFYSEGILGDDTRRIAGALGY